MRLVSRMLLLSILLIHVSYAYCQDKFDPAARAKTIAPFIDEQTLVVAHADLSRVKVDALVDKLVEITQTKEDSLEPRKTIDSMLSSFLKLGGKDVYAVFSLEDYPPKSSESMPFSFIVPLPEGVKISGMSSQTPGKIFSIAASVIELAPSLFGGIERWQGAWFVGNKDTLERLKKNKPDPRPELAQAFEAAGDTAFQILLLPPKYSRRVIEEIMPTLPSEIGGGPSTTITDGLLWAALSVDMPPKPAIRLTIQSKDTGAARKLQSNWEELYNKVVLEDKDFRRDVPKAVEVMKMLTPQAQGDRLSIALDEANIDFLGKALVMPALGDAKQNAQRVASMNNLREIAVAMNMYESQNKSLPAPANYDKSGKPLLSWRVHILPFIGQQKLYEQFHLDEPWDSDHNKKLVAEMPVIYKSPKSTILDKGRTNYLLPTGKDTLYTGREGPKLKEIKNAAKTILVVEADDEHAVVWTKPDDLQFNAEKPWTGLKGTYSNGFLAVYCDGHVESMSYENSENMILHQFAPQK
jgi:hypothetical protein